MFRIDRGRARSFGDSGFDREQVGALTKTIQAALDAAEVPYDSFRAELLKDSDVGRFVLSMLRIVCDANDLVAHRVLLQTLRGVGVGTCAQIADQVADENMVYRQIFYSTAGRGRFSGRAGQAIDRARTICGEISEWDSDEEMSARRDAIRRIVAQYRSGDEADAWEEVVAALPGAMTLRELRDYVWADAEAQQDDILRRASERIGEGEPRLVPPPPGRVRLMTLHGSKGLTARYVFIPGLEELLFPGSFREAVPRPNRGSSTDSVRRNDESPYRPHPLPGSGENASGALDSNGGIALCRINRRGVRESQRWLPPRRASAAAGGRAESLAPYPRSSGASDSSSFLIPAPSKATVSSVSARRRA